MRVTKLALGVQLPHELHELGQLRISLRSNEDEDLRWRAAKIPRRFGFRTEGIHTLVVNFLQVSKFARAATCGRQGGERGIIRQAATLAAPPRKTEQVIGSGREGQPPRRGRGGVAIHKERRS